LGLTIEEGVPTLRVWAPTARSVRLYLFADSDGNSAAEVTAMRIDPDTGVWSISGTTDWIGNFYLFAVDVYVPSEGSVQTNLVTDPYSYSLALNSTRSQIVDLSDLTLMPAGWLEMTKPELDAAEDIVLYELHIRDFSVNDMSVPEEYRGTLMAFTV
jgi:pullulanase/glycogen debranching enzyme